MRLRHCFIMVAAFAAVAFAQQQRINLLAVMGGFGKGKATFKTRTSSSGFEVQIESEGEHLMRNTRYVLNLGNGKIVKTVVTNILGEYHWSQRRIGTSQPMLKAGDKAVLTTVTGVPVQGGFFR